VRARAAINTVAARADAVVLTARLTKVRNSTVHRFDRLR
jgi:hypothetical protein